MDTPNSQKSLALKTPGLFSCLLEKLREYRYPFFASLIFGFLSYMFTFTNKLVSSDDLLNFFTKGNTVRLGRWGLELMSGFLPDCSMPWFHGVIALLFFAAAVCLIVSLLSIRTPMMQVLTAGLIVCFPSLIGTMGYMFTVSSYGVAFFLAALAAWFWNRRHWSDLLLGILCCILSTSIYQAYISITTSLLVLILIRRTMYTDTPVKKLLLQGIYFVSMLGLSLGLYWVLTQIIMKVTGISMYSYAEVALDNTSSLLMRPLDCIRILAYILLLGYQGLVHEGLIQVLHLICLAILLFEIIFWCCRNRKPGRIAMLLFLLVMFSLALNAILLFTAVDSAHSLVLYGFACVYLLAAMLIENQTGILSDSGRVNRIRTLGLDLAVLCMAVTVFSNISLANRVSLSMYMRYENNYSIATSMVTQIEATEGFTEDTPVAIIGNFPTVNKYEKLMDADHIVGTCGEATLLQHVPTFLSLYCGVDFNILDSETAMRLINNETFQKMPIFPDQGSIQNIDGTVAVKLPPWNLPEEYLDRILPEEDR